ncbi:hypothetical protein POL68_19195 [Stigmatella sp. ncwal1]|uniref:DUF4175 domain-containing protein n=1 Tax=Stigmatella ashevillensis TaxID=2995309 RepID=A0ABT5DE70_9BACT|nr:hypothetical protein [Stigmatella ashevillena]MDC0710612.1 hypothetical protein [Stigmatella ashevillena]
MASSAERRFQALVLAPVRRVQRRLNAMAWVEAGIAPLWAAATACVAARLLMRDAALWALPVFLVAGAVGWWLRARGRSVSLQHAAVLADRSAQAGGLLLTCLERPAGEWELSANQFARAVKPPRLRWHRPVGALAGAALFLAAGLLLPLPPPTVRPRNAAASSLVTAVQAQAEALAQEEPLGAPMEEELRRLAEEAAEGRFDSADWEAVDGVEKRLAERAAEAAAELAGAAEAARELEDALGAAGSAEGAALEREQLERALMALGEGEGAKGQGGEGEQGEGAQEAQAQAAAQQAAGNLDQIADLRKTLERRQGQLEERFGQGNAGRPGQRRQGMAGKGSGKQGEGGEGEGQEGQEGQGGHASRSVQGRSGEGSGVGRGGESQPLVFGPEAEMDPERLRFQPLPPGQGGEAGGLWGLRAAEPRKDGATGPPPAVRGTSAQGEAAPGHSSSPLLPRNRDLVKRYFGGE